MTEFRTQRERWQAIKSRNPDADDYFLYGVLSTGIYCYPSCPSKLSSIDNTRFYSSREQALDAGFRACKRCRSDLPPIRIRQQNLVTEACRLLEDTDAAWSITAIAEELSVSRYHLSKLFQQYLNLSPKAYQKAVRSQQLQHRLTSTNTITRAIYDAGYPSTSSYYQTKDAALEKTARVISRGGQGLSIRYDVGQSVLGPLIVALTDHGVCSVLFADNTEELINQLTVRFPKAQLEQSTKAVEKWMQIIIGMIDDPRRCDDIPLDIHGTAFQHKVWQALRNIEMGSTASYTDIAEAINQPKAARAVASACAANPIAVLVPCHRVIRSDGSQSGYRWGVRRKQHLLSKERDSSSKDRES